MKLLKFYNNHFFYLTLLIIILITMVVLVVWPAFNTITTIKKEINQEREILENKLSLGINIKNINEELMEAEKHQEKFNSAFISVGQELELINFIEKIAKNNEVEINLKPDFNLPKTDTSIIKLPINLTASGEFNNIYSFIKDLDKSPFYLISEQVNLIRDKDNSLILTMTAHTYLKK